MRFFFFKDNLAQKGLAQKNLNNIPQILAIFGVLALCAEQ